jgi:protein-S-isoprenylcysteine O-methyltransferase Ste14
MPVRLAIYAHDLPGAHRRGRQISSLLLHDRDRSDATAILVVFIAGHRFLDQNSQMRVAVGWVVAICWVAFGLVWIVGAFTAKRAAEGQRGWRRWPYGVALAVLLLLVTRGPTVPATLILWPESAAVLASAAAITVIGLMIAIWSRIALGIYWSGNVVVKDAHVIIDRGAYRFVRHPIYSGVLLMVIGTALWWGRLVGLVICAVTFAGFMIKARFEEQLLSKHFPVEYGRYKARVKRALVPWLL